MELHSEHLRLESVGLEAAEALLLAYNGDAQFNVWSGCDPVLTLDLVCADMEETLKLPGGTVWRIADHQDMLVGVAATALVPQPDTGWIALLLIRREYQRRGYGSEAAALLEKYLFSDPQVTRIGLAVLTQNVPGLAFWEGRGYGRDSARRDDHNQELYRYFLPRPTGGDAG